ncbi:Thioredoxin [bioreactor metagenome]|uniref:Thioredoxin n=1 Tax=bioreactor metagenome TaxID=1076179 RepID=A0A645JBW7_9ZZZZ
MSLQNKITVIRFSRANCGPCRTLERLLEGIEDDLSEVEFLHFDAEENPEKAVEYEVRSVPATLIEFNGEVLRHFTGIDAREKLLRTVAEVRRETGI